MCKCTQGVLMGLSLFLLIISVTFADVPTVINYQGRLTNTAGHVVPNANYSIVFTIYDAATLGNVKWTETRSVTTDSGLFSVVLGTINQIEDTVFNQPDRWLGIKVGTDPEMSPRVNLTSVSYSNRVSTVDEADGGIIKSKVSIGPGHINTGTNAFTVGQNNTTSGDYSSATGRDNVASGEYSVVAGGRMNVASGGANDTTSSLTSRSENFAITGPGATVAGGVDNTASGNYSSIGGGHYNRARGLLSVIAGGGGQNDAADSNYTEKAWSSVGGGRANAAKAGYSTVSGGAWNAATAKMATVSGGTQDTASGDHAVVGGGFHNIASGQQSTISGGHSNVADTSYAAIGGGQANSATGIFSTIAGGSTNKADGDYSSIGGGVLNTASGLRSTVGGGDSDSAEGQWSTVPGGRSNKASGNYSLAAGRRAKAINSGAFVWADSTDADFSSTANNQFIIRAGGNVGINTNNPTSPLTVAGEIRTTSGGIRFPDNTLQTTAATGGGANGWTDGGTVVRLDTGTDSVGIGTTAPTQKLDVSGNIHASGTISSGNTISINGVANTITSASGPLTIGTTDNNALDVQVNGNRALRLEPNATSPNVIGGQSSNSATAGVVGATIGGGGTGANSNRVTDNFGTVGGGENNTAGDIVPPTTGVEHTTVGGGQGNTASGQFATVSGGNANSATGQSTTVGGGSTNTASGSSSTIAGGQSNLASGNFTAVSGGVGNTASGIQSSIGGGSTNTASGIRSTIPGGSDNTASGNYSFAAGHRAKANHPGTFVWADTTEADFASTANNQFLIRADRVGIGLNNPSKRLEVAGSIKVGTNDTVFTSNLSSNSPLRFDAPAGTIRMYISDVNGNVGIGNTSPAQKLDVTGTAQMTGFKLTTGATNGFVLTSDASGVGTWQAAGGGANGWTDGGTVVRLDTGADSVGIGTTTPTKKLEVVGSAKVTDTLYVSNVSSNSPLRLQTAGTTRAFIDDATGNVGIGNTSPAQKLDVTGTAQMTGLKLTTGASNGFVLTSDASGLGTWQAASSFSGWSLTGNSGTTPGTNFVGTTDNLALEFKVNSLRAFRIEPNATSPSLIGGFSGNAITAGVIGATVSGGGASANTNRVTDDYGSIGGGFNNRAGDNTGTTSDKLYATVGGGQNNIASGTVATVGGGANNTASEPEATVSGGASNIASGADATVAGGSVNTASSIYATVGGGNVNTASNVYATVGGGQYDTASGQYSTVPGGRVNTASGSYSFAAGRRAKANHSGSFVWADDTDADFASTAAGQFLIRADKVGIGLNNPSKKLEVAGSIKVGTNDTVFTSNLSSNSPLRFDAPAGTVRMYISDVNGNVGIGNTSPAQKLDVTGTAQMTGLKLTTGASNGFVLTSDASGLGTWQAASSFSGWSLTGNSGTTPGTNFVGTTDNNALELKVNSLRAFRVEPNATSPNIVGGFNGNSVTAGALGATIGGGGSSSLTNRVTDDYGFVGGGQNNRAGDNAGTTSDRNWATVGGGFNNTASGGTASIGGGSINTASGAGATVAGGQSNTASGGIATVGGGQDNIASGNVATIGGGSNDTASGQYSIVPGGRYNKASGDYSYAAGRRAKAVNLGSFVWADATDADFASTADNQFLIRADKVGIGLNNPTKKLEVAGSIKVGTNDTVFTSNLSSNSPLRFDAPAGTVRMYISDVNGNVGIGNTSPAQKLDVTGTAQMTGFKLTTSPTNGFVLTTDATGVGTWQAAASSGWSLTGNGGTTPGTNFVGTTDNNALEFKVNSLRALRIEPNGTSPNIVGGFSGNSATAGVLGAAIGGGGVSGSTNRVTDDYGTVPGGQNNQAGDNSGTTSDKLYATVGGGFNNIASGNSATVGGGQSNTASGFGATVGGGLFSRATLDYATVGGGVFDTASGVFSTVPGGRLNVASGNYSFAAGRRAKAINYGSFVWADSTDADFTSTAANQFLIRADKVGIGLNNPTKKLEVAGSIKVGTNDTVFTSYLSSNSPLTLEAPAGTARMYISDVNGNVGIGNTSPAQKLDVTGTAQMTGFKLTTSPTNGFVLTTDATGVGTWQAAASSGWSLTGNSGTTPGTNFVGTTDNNALEFKVNSLRALRIEPNATSPNLLGGFNGNTITSGVLGATLSGGGASANTNRITDNYGTLAGGYNNQVGDNAGTTSDKQYAAVGGGLRNISSGFASTIAGGEVNTASNNYSTVGGGFGNVASGAQAIIGGGQYDTASGQYSSIPGGLLNQAAGNYSFSAGRRAKANHLGTFVWADSSADADFASTANNQFLIRADRVGIGLNNPTKKLEVAGSIKVGANDTVFTSYLSSNSPLTLEAPAGTARMYISDVNGNVGVGNTAPAQRLDVTGTAQMTGFKLTTAPTNGFVLTSDATGVGTWQAAGGGSGWSLTGNSGTTPGTNFVGTTDNNALEFKVNSLRAFRIEPSAFSPNVIGGFNGNTVTSGALGATIAGGGLSTNINQITDDHGTVGGGRDNQAGDNAGTTSDRAYATVAGGLGNRATGFVSTVGGGAFNMARGEYAVVTGGGGGAAIDSNSASGDYSTIGGGKRNSISTAGDSATISGGARNSATAAAATVGGGNGNTASGPQATVGGGVSNTASNTHATVGGGTTNTASGGAATVGGGNGNTASGNQVTVGGGQSNTASNTYATVGGGFSNTATNINAAVGGGGSDTASGQFSTVPGGSSNKAAGNYSFAAGRRAKANHLGTFVWSDSSSNTDFSSKRTNQFLIRADGGVGIGTDSAVAQLEVQDSAATVVAFDRRGDDGVIVSLQQQGTEEGTISVSGITVSYNAFTGSHYGWTDETIEMGTLVSFTGINRHHHDNSDAEIIYGIRTTTMANDPACLGAYLGLQESNQLASNENPHLVMAVGNGEMWVVESGQNIKPGDYLISSDVSGHAMKDDAEKYPIGHIVGRAAEAVDWSQITESVDGRKHARISVLFGNFVRSNVASLNQTLEIQEKTINRQQSQIDALMERLSNLEKQTGLAQIDK